MEDIKYLTKEQVNKLRDACESAALLSKRRGTYISDVRNWMIIDLILNTGLRASEVINLKVGDIKVGHGQRELVVKDGKGGKSRTVYFSNELKNHIKEFLRWKETLEESREDDAPMFVSNKGGPLTYSGLRAAVRKAMKSADLEGYSIHSLRHTYATHLFDKTRNIRFVQRQLGHSDLSNTMIYVYVVDAKEEADVNIYEGSPYE